MRLFNGKMSGARTELTECMFRRLVKMFPILNQLRYFVEDNQVLLMDASFYLTSRGHASLLMMLTMTWRMATQRWRRRGNI